MDRDIIEKTLAQAETRVAVGNQLIASQRDYVASLERSGRDPSQAKTLLDAFLELQLMHLANRDRLRGRLEALQAGQTV